MRYESYGLTSGDRLARLVFGAVDGDMELLESKQNITVPRLLLQVQPALAKKRSEASLFSRWLNSCLSRLLSLTPHGLLLLAY
ncbi:MAG: hypothetical protein IMY78_02240 [Chloroflexi bacterium]|nr:hypothetical protein [Chloroflexota bacterium]